MVTIKAHLLQWQERGKENATSENVQKTSTTQDICRAPARPPLLPW